jgi:hypothetical protein
LRLWSQAKATLQKLSDTTIAPGPEYLSARFSERDWIDPPKTSKSQAMVKHISKGNQAPVKVLYVDASQNPPHLIEVIFSKFIPFSMDLSRLLEE